MSQADETEVAVVQIQDATIKIVEVVTNVIDTIATGGIDVGDVTVVIVRVGVMTMTAVVVGRISANVGIVEKRDIRSWIVPVHKLGSRQLRAHVLPNPDQKSRTKSKFDYRRGVP